MKSEINVHDVCVLNMYVNVPNYNVLFFLNVGKEWGPLLCFSGYAYRQAQARAQEKETTEYRLKCLLRG